MDIKKLMGLGQPAQPKVEKQEKSGKTSETGAKGSREAKGAAGDTIRLSPEAKLVSQAMTTAQSAPDVRREKVEELKAQVEAGTYTPDSRKTAEKLVQSDFDLYA